MRTSQRPDHTSVIDRLLETPWRLDLVQALRLIEQWQRRNGVVPASGTLPHVRFRNSLSMNFPASQIEALTVTGRAPITSSRDLQAALARDELVTITFTPAFLGFFGVNGTMPNFYTDDIVEQIGRDKYEGTRAFFDIFYNRTMGLYFQAACKHGVQHRIDEDGAAAILPMQLALAGKKKTAASTSMVGDTFIAHYAALLRHRPVSASLIEGVLHEYFGLPVRLEQFVGRFDRLHQHELCMLGVQSATLGGGAVLGERVRECHSHVRVHIGPLSIADYERFLPGTPGDLALRQLLALFATPAIVFELHLILCAGDVVPVHFDAPHGNRLGYDTCLVSGPVLEDCREYRSNLDR
jgi:type VI secretion system protein ImpH